MLPAINSNRDLFSTVPMINVTGPELCKRGYYMKQSACLLSLIRLWSAFTLLFQAWNEKQVKYHKHNQNTKQEGSLSGNCAVCSQSTMQTFNSCTKCVGSPGITHDRTPRLPRNSLGMDAWMTHKTEGIFDSQTTWVTDVLGIFFAMLSMRVSATKNWQTSGCLVQELNVCTVPIH